MRHKIYKVLNDDFTDRSGKPTPRIELEKPWNQADVIGTVQDHSEVTLEDLVSMLDQDAESRNAHDFCGSHRLLAALLYRHLGRDKATEIMLDAAKYGGLQGMTGVCCEGDAYADLKVGKAGFDWHGTFALSGKYRT